MVRDPKTSMAWLRNLSKYSSTIAKLSSSPKTNTDPFFLLPAFTFLSHFSSNSIQQKPSNSNTKHVIEYSGLLEATKPHEKPRVVVLGSGWAGCRLMKGLDTTTYDIVCVSPRNHMVFTPLLASTCVGTLEFRSVAEPIGRIQPALSREPGSYFFLANCTAIDTHNHMVQCETVTDGEETIDPWKFSISYDKLVIALGSKPSTFGIQGVKEYAIFLREVYHAQEIRRKLLLNLMLSDVPGITEEEKRRLLHCVVVGGGPTGVEFSGELSDFIMKDVQQRYAHVKDYIRVTLIEANEILSSFDDRLRRYATNQLTKSGVRLVRGIVKDVKAQKIILSDGTEVPYGLLVWSTGVSPAPIIQSLDLPKEPSGRIGVDEWLRVPSVQDVFSIGDCCGFLETTGRQTLPALAQVAERQGKYLAELLNRIGKEGAGHANSAKEIEFGDPFVYKHLGSMATIGRYKALVDLRQSKEAKGLSLAGFLSFFIWRSAYITRVISWRNRFYVFINWVTTLIFGRDISRL
ncbi:internal alternative NAD(P)H-ubiquinone oxidoreductase A1, mitochondrial-like [Arachis stenosperma]|uniref:internal alternative NAD(P)H-ubiquinone oxidoreductase A1, mitochondrial-like n=1 Tax=Arachis stenosperma TaxID=217475 RepID=UPI0025ABB930|nr:internal alternative NAD(P)H-ubiquinone oxidoreductase A1, mitochondrial-like [Arachis stenosperma]XP_057744150.1 internal alternative NAD(P)H-ubiquinone oxidoreductase A1, mitochondrial-like [Arachis stenosperma]